MKHRIVLTPDVISVLDAAQIADTHLVLTGQLNRDLYLRTNAALEALGGKWSKRDKAHVFDGSPAEAIENAILTGSVVNMDKELDYFPTPDEIADLVVSYADVGDDDFVLEPSAGEGALINALRRAHHNWRVDFCELDARRAAAVLETCRNTNLVAHDFLTYQPGEQYHRIVANPPFSQRRDLQHVTHMWELLASGGRLVSVMASGIQFRADRKTSEFKALFPRYDIIDLPSGSFEASGTGVNTVIFVADKRS